jgi:hypothetical protein
MTERFSDLIKIPRQPAARLLAMANTKLETKVESPANAPVEAVLAELDAKNAIVDMLLLLSVALPPRERVWWSCLAARDMLPADQKLPLCLETSEAWVFKPTEENRAAAISAIELAESADDTVHCATAVAFFDGTLGPGDMAEHQAPVGAAEMSVFAMVVTSMCAAEDDVDAAGDHLVERALDIARGRSGQVPPPPPRADPDAEEEEEDDEPDPDDEDEDDEPEEKVA